MATATARTPRHLAVGIHDVPAHDGWLCPPEAERLAAFRFAKRRSESRLGRWAAKRALAAELGLDTDDTSLRRLVIRNAPDGAPEAFVDGRPAGVSISMTDRADWAVCTVVPGGGSIGCDLELIEPRTERFVADWFTEAERASWKGASDPDLMANLIWSAKESALKVLRTGLRRDTRSVEVRLDDRHDLASVAGSVADSVVEVEAGGWRPLVVTTAEGDRFDGWWQRSASFVLTVVADEPIGAPVSMIDPSPLTSAVPSHRWMDSLEVEDRPPEPGDHRSG